MHLNLIYTFCVFSFVKATVPENRVIKIVPVSTTELPSTPSVKECVREQLQELKQQLQINNNESKLEFITIQEQNKNILKNEEIYFTKLEANCISGLTEFRKILNEIKNTNKNEITHLHVELEKIYQNINAKIDKTVQIIQKEINANSKRLEDYITRACSTKLNTSELTTISHTTIPSPDCYEIKLSGNYLSGVYKIQPKSSCTPFWAWCDMDTREGGWTYVLNRFNGSQNFEQDWKAYKFGFGTVSKEFWIGLENLYLLTSSKRTQLLVELSDWEENAVYAHYDNFEIGSEKEGYKLKSLGTYTGTAGDSLNDPHLGMKFSTYDRDQDKTPGNCAKRYHGGWWHEACHHSQLTGLYLKEYNLDQNKQGEGIHWASFKRLNYSLKSVKMMIKPL